MALREESGRPDSLVVPTEIPRRDDVLNAIGSTPLLRLDRIAPGQHLYAKAEFLNPGGSVKSRSALGMVKDALTHGRLREGGTLVEVSSGNEGVSLAMVGARLHIHVVVVMPDDLPPERRWMIEAYGGEVVEGPALPNVADTFANLRRMAEARAAETPGAYLSRQFDNPANTLAQEAIGREIVDDWPRSRPLAAFVAAVGTGGTLTGAGRVIRESFPDVEIVAVEPLTSAVLSGGTVTTRAQYGIGEGFVPSILDREMVTCVETVSDAEAYDMVRRVARLEGLLVGVSSGTNLVASLRTLDRLGLDQGVVTVLPDSGERYLCDPRYRTSLLGAGPERRDAGLDAGGRPC